MMTPLVFMKKMALIFMFTIQQKLENLSNKKYNLQMSQVGVDSMENFYGFWKNVSKTFFKETILISNLIRKSRKFVIHLSHSKTSRYPT